jgi:hypothetical protein
MDETVSLENAIELALYGNYVAGWSERDAQRLRDELAQLRHGSEFLKRIIDAGGVSVEIAGFGMREPCPHGLGLKVLCPWCAAEKN